jgi:hypothetical protein
MNQADPLAQMARSIIDANRYLTLGTTEPDHRPRLSPVYFTHADYRTFYWVSAPEAQHSRNIAARPAIAIVMFDSTAEIGQGRAVYIDADASIVADDDLPRCCGEAFAHGGPDAVRFAPHELAGDAVLRLFRAGATSCAVHIPGRDPVYGTGVDRRRDVAF